eukprot:422181-Pleurochrysis_carterae.AAC.1
MAAHELGLIKQHASLRQVLKSGQLYERKHKVEDVQKQLTDKREKHFEDARQCATCGVDEDLGGSSA